MSPTPLQILTVLLFVGASGMAYLHFTLSPEEREVMWQAFAASFVTSVVVSAALSRR